MSDLFGVPDGASASRHSRQTRFSGPVPVTAQLTAAILATRSGWALPARRSPGVTGELFMLRMQARIAEKLQPERLARYIDLRDRVRRAVRLLNGNQLDSADEVFRDCDTLVHEFAGDSELLDLGRSWLEQARAYADVRRQDPEAAEKRLLRSLDSDTRLEQVHGYELMHIGRVHAVHLWLRVQEARGAVQSALDAANAIIRYVNGFADALPVGTGWSRRQAARIPADLAAAMTRRVADDLGILLAGLDRQQCVRALDRLHVLQSLPFDVHEEIVDWVRIKSAWARGSTDELLARLVPYLAAGRRETRLWYAALLDMCRAARALRPRAALIFAEEVAERVRHDPDVPGRLRPALRALADETPTVPWAAHSPPRRFHLMCMGLPRSGVVSLYTLFARFRAANEYAEAESIRMLVQYHNKAVSRDALVAYMERRDRESALEMDAASFLHLAADVILSLSDETRFVLPVREPGAWLASYLRELLRVHDRFRARGKTPPCWQRDYGAMLLGRFDWEEIASPEARRKSLGGVARRFLIHWARSTETMLDTLPRERTLVLRTQDLGPMRDRIAAFAGLPPDSLSGTGHSNPSPPGPGGLEGLPQRWLAKSAADICGPTYARALGRCDR